MNDWVKWKGGECPVDGLAEIVVKLRSGRECAATAGAMWWNHLYDGSGSGGGDIIAYRLAESQAEPQAHMMSAPDMGQAIHNPFAVGVDYGSGDQSCTVVRHGNRIVSVEHSDAPDMGRKHVSDAAYEACKAAFGYDCAERSEMETDCKDSGTVQITVAELDAKDAEIAWQQARAAMWERLSLQAQDLASRALRDLELMRKASDAKGERCE
jgi:hypothetical protein